MPFACAYLRPCDDYARINETYYNVTCFLACEKLEKNMYLLNCAELYNYSENFINKCYNKLECEYVIYEIYYDLNNLLNKVGCNSNISIPCNITGDQPTSFYWAYIIFIVILSISLSICSIFNCRRLWIYYYNKRMENREIRLNTAFINDN
jgi:hypothetical protein